MTLRKRTLIVFGVTYCVLLGFIYLLLSRAVSHRFAELESAEVRGQVDLARRTLAAEAEALGLVVKDYSTWDDTYRYMADGNVEYVRVNFPDDTFRNLKINWVALVDGGGRLRYGKAYDLTAQRAIPLPAAVKALLAETSGPLRPQGLEEAPEGLLGLGEAAMLVAARPILTSEGAGPARGYMAMGRFLDAALVKRLAERTRTNLAVYSQDDPKLPQEARHATETPSISTSDAAETVGQITVRDLAGKPALVLQVKAPRVYYHQAMGGLRVLLMVTLLLGLLYGAGALFILERSVLGRLAGLSREVAAVGAQGDASLRLKPRAGTDELATLATTINEMLASLQAALADRLQAQQQQTAIFAQAYEGILLADLQTTEVTQANAAMHAMLGMEPGTLEGRRLDQVLADAKIGNWFDLLAGSGQPQTVEASLQVAPQRTVELEMTLALLEEKDSRLVCVMARDTTERRLAQEERIRLEERLRESQKLQSLGQLAAGLAHNFNNVLAVIVSGVELTQMECEPAIAQRLAMVLDSCQKASGMIKQFMLFSRRSPLEKLPVRIGDVLEQVAEMCRRTFDRRIELRVYRAPQVPLVVGDASQLHGVLLNMCINARDALESDVSFGRPMCVELRASVVRVEANSNTHPGVMPGRYVQLTVSDNGPGMPTDVKSRVFEPFFTTKDVGKGTGLGLSTAWGVVSELGGWIDCETEEGAGTAFHIYLPVAVSEPLALEPAEARTQDGRGRGETILFVDDEDALRVMIQGVLERNGYRVMLAVDGRDGLAKFAQHCDQIGAVVLDLSMPRMSGWECLRGMKALSPEAKVVVCSGYPVAEGELEGVTAVVNKPFETNQLMVTLRRVLDLPDASG